MALTIKKKEKVPFCFLNGRKFQKSRTSWGLLPNIPQRALEHIPWQTMVIPRHIRVHQGYITAHQGHTEGLKGSHKGEEFFSYAHKCPIMTSWDMCPAHERKRPAFAFPGVLCVYVVLWQSCRQRCAQSSLILSVSRIFRWNIFICRRACCYTCKHTAQHACFLSESKYVPSEYADLPPCSNRKVKTPPPPPGPTPGHSPGC